MSPVNSNVFYEADSFGSKTDNGTWTGMIDLVSNGVADIGVGDFIVTKERCEVVSFLNAIGFGR
jgi:ABC-type amino acid transport substrate-binding protein